ncbi:class I SAM-dependent methyltransferase [Segnochrobactrum spirostomi]|uniref:Class I SAM-dependent methyltransferase n=1 Tax=Segnochrobactrum spirostomi TaxID=2608987 RepID=A0A6A7Y692_9HYPH|nr:class I SAM-dependent methyltransferase [Segnochrobactrum spirostomi]MQT13099.1 class I SAM-dependent methyltransferase [Segnochrobactrum spirostomi]
MTEAIDWRAINRANWDERVAIHLKSPMYDLGPLRAGRARLQPIEAAELGPVAGLRILHLQCHFGRDSLVLAQQGAEVVGLDFSGPAIAAARSLAVELGLESHARFVEADVYDARAAVGEPAAFDRVFVTWGTIGWLPDIAEWARIVAHFLKPGGSLYFAEGHPAALVFDDAAAVDGVPGRYMPYFLDGPLVETNPTDYADPDARLANAKQCWFSHPLGAVVTALIAAGLRIEFLHEHPKVTWQMFAELVEDADGLFGWPDAPWLPLAYSLSARKPAA